MLVFRKLEGSNFSNCFMYTCFLDICPAKRYVICQSIPNKVDMLSSDELSALDFSSYMFSIFTTGCTRTPGHFSWKRLLPGKLKSQKYWKKQEIFQKLVKNWSIPKFCDLQIFRSFPSYRKFKLVNLRTNCSGKSYNVSHCPYLQLN